MFPAVPRVVRMLGMQKTALIEGAQKALLLVGSIALVGVGSEVVLRLLGHQGAPHATIDNAYLVDDSVLDWRYRPNSQRKSGRIVYSFNGAGFRDVEHQLPKPPGRFRIVVVGDSVTEGSGVRFEEMFSRVLQSRLGPSYEVITLAQGGLNTPQEIHLLEKHGLAYEPDLVILNFVLNDCAVPTRLANARRYMARKDSELGILFGLPIDPRVKRLLKRSAFLYFVKDRVSELPGRLLGKTEDWFVRVWQHESSRGRVVEGFDRLALVAEKRNFDVALLIWPILMDYAHYSLRDVHGWVAHEARSRGFSVIDLLPEFSRAGVIHLKGAAEDGVHPNALGHRKAVEALLERHDFRPGSVPDQFNPRRGRLSSGRPAE